MGFYKAKDTISGQEGTAFATIDGENIEMFYVKKLEATIEKQKAEMKAIGRRGIQAKATGWKGTGSMTIYYATTKFRDMMLKYVTDGIDAYFDIQVTNEDPNSGIGKQRVTLKNVNLDKVIITKIDVDSDMLDEDIDFTFDDVEILDSFTAPALG